MKEPPNAQIYEIGCLDWNIYKCITDQHITDKVIITGKQLSHIRQKHPDAYNDALNYIEQILKEPDYIIKDKRPNTGLIIKQIIAGQKHMLLVLRICTTIDKFEYKNSIITGWEISESRLKNYLKNKPILYKKE